MSGKLDDLFSPERLRRRWGEDGERRPAPAATEPAASETPSGPATEPSALELWREIRALADQRYEGAAREALAPLLLQAERLIEARDGQAGARSADAPPAADAASATEHSAADDGEPAPGAAAEQTAEPVPQAEDISLEQLLATIEDVIEALDLA